MSAALIQRLIEAGTPAALIAEVAMELGRAAGAAEALESRRKNERNRKARSREVTGQHVTERDSADTPSPQSPPLKTPPDPLKNTPPLTPQPDPSSDDDASLRPEHVFEFYQELAKGLGRPIPRDFTPERRALVRARIAQHPLADFHEVFARCRGSPFLRGDRGRTPLTFDWLMQKKNFQKVLEGNYEG